MNTPARLPTTLFRVLAVLLLLSAFAGRSHACPFCSAQQPTLAQQLNTAQVVALGEVLQRKGKACQFRIHKLHKGQLSRGGNTLELPAPGEVKTGQLTLLWATREAGQDQLQWTVQPVDETSYGYVMQAPALDKPAAERLGYFARYLEHANPLIATDAYHEFAAAAYPDVREVAGGVPFERLQSWLTDTGVPDDRKGLYGLLLGIHAANQHHEGTTNETAEARVLRKLIDQPRDDFRAGFDGILGGYLLATGESGLALIEQRFFANPKAAEGDIRHARRALDFYWEHGRGISPDRQRQALRKLLARSGFARQTVIDLARWKDWQALPEVIALYDKPNFRSPELQRAIIGYLLISPTDDAAKKLDRLRKSDPQRVAETEKLLSVLGGLR